MSDVKLQRTIARFQAKIDSGEYYEAHQTLRTITNRFVKLKQYREAADLLFTGSKVLSHNKEYASAADLIQYLLQVYVESNQQVTAESRIKIVELVQLLPDTDPGLADLANQAIKWSTQESRFGDNVLHHVFGLKFLHSVQSDESLLTEDERRKVFSYAESHLILGTHESVAPYVDFLVEWANALDQDPGVFLARAVINFAYLKNIHFVKEAVARFVDAFAKAQAPTALEEGDITIYEFESPLLTFLQLLAVTLTKENAGDKFLKLYHHYKPVLATHELTAPVEYLGRTYFGLNLGSATATANPLASLMGGLFK